MRPTSQSYKERQAISLMDGSGNKSYKHNVRSRKLGISKSNPCQEVSEMIFMRMSNSSLLVSRLFSLMWVRTAPHNDMKYLRSQAVLQYFIVVGLMGWAHAKMSTSTSPQLWFKHRSQTSASWNNLRLWCMYLFWSWQTNGLEIGMPRWSPTSHASTQRQAEKDLV